MKTTVVDVKNSSDDDDGDGNYKNSGDNDDNGGDGGDDGDGGDSGIDGCDDVNILENTFFVTFWYFDAETICDHYVLSISSSLEYLP